MKSSKILPLAAFLVALSPVAAMAERTICTPTAYFNWEEIPPLLIAIDADRAAGSTIIAIDIETGEGEDLIMQGEAGKKSRTYTIVNRGSLKDNQDFIATSDDGALLHIDLRADPMTFTLTNAEGTVSGGTCDYQYDKPKP